MIVFSLAILEYGRAISFNLDFVVNWLFVCLFWTWNNSTLCYPPGSYSKQDYFPIVEFLGLVQFLFRTVQFSLIQSSSVTWSHDELMILWSIERFRRLKAKCWMGRMVIAIPLWHYRLGHCSRAMLIMSINIRHKAHWSKSAWDGTGSPF